MSDSQAGERGEMAFQFSVYPLRQTHIRPAIRAAVQATAKAGVEVRVGRLSTFARGEEEAVFRALRAAFTAARSFGPTAMVITLTTGMPSEATVGDVQAAVEE